MSPLRAASGGRSPMLSPGLRWPARGSDPRKGRGIHWHVSEILPASRHGWEDDPRGSAGSAPLPCIPGESVACFPGHAHRPRRVAGTRTYARRARRCWRLVRHTWHASPLPPQCGCRCRSGGRSSGVRGGALGRVAGPCGRGRLSPLRALGRRRGHGSRGLLCEGAAGAHELSRGDRDASCVPAGATPIRRDGRLARLQPCSCRSR